MKAAHSKPQQRGVGRAVCCLAALYAALVIDVVTGLHFNGYGFGREPGLFALGTVCVCGLLWRWQNRALGVMGLVLCCAWLLVDPGNNGFDAVLAPTLVMAVLAWLWQKYKIKHED